MRLSVALLLAHVSVVATLTGCHGDRDKDHRSRQNCTAAGFSQVPLGLDPSTMVLLLPNNLFSGLAWSSFRPFLQIHEVDLTGNQLPQVPAPAPSALPTLSVLRLGSNLISALPGGSFSACPALTELYLDNNAIGSLSGAAFAGLDRLEILDLSSNRIGVLPQLLLHPLASIETLVLEENRVQELPDAWFSPKEEVPYLFLSANPWACGCALRYLHHYLDQYGLNVYTRRGPTLTVHPGSVVCHSPPRFHRRPVISLEPSELCPSTSPGPEAPWTRTTPTGAPWTSTTPTGAPWTRITPTRAPWTRITPTGAPWTRTTPTGAPWTRTTPTGAPWTSTTPTGAPWTRTTPTGASWTQTPPTRTPLSRGHAAGLHPSAPPLAPVSSTRSPDQVPSGGRAAAALRGSAHLCACLSAGLLLLCLLSAAVVMVTVGRLLLLYRTYRPLEAALRRRRAGPAELRLLPNQRGEGAGPVYRSVLFVRRDEEEEEEVQEEVRFHRTTLRRLLSREEQLQGWSLVEEECGGAARPGRRGYSLVLRQEAGRGAEPLEWLLGAWEETRGGARGPLDPGLLS